MKAGSRLPKFQFTRSFTGETRPGHQDTQERWRAGSWTLWLAGELAPASPSHYRPYFAMIHGISVKMICLLPAMDNCDDWYYF